MEKNIQNIELINQFINGLLSINEIKDFENRLQTDVDFKAIYNEHVIFLEGIKRNQLKVEIQTARKSYVRTKWLKYIGISIGVILVASILYSILFKTDSPQIIQPINNIEVVSDSVVAEKPTKQELEFSEEVKEITETKIKTEKEQSIQKESFKVVNEPILESEKAEVIQDTTNTKKLKPISPELNSLYKLVKKAPEIIELNIEKDVTITCKEGTKLTIPAKSFVDAKTKKLVRGKINLEVTEFYKLSDMLLANLTTKSDDKVLETGGMLYLNANKKGSKLKLKKGKHIQVVFNNKEKEDMQLFYGEELSEGVNWKIQEMAVDVLTEENTEELESIEEDIEVPLTVVEEVPIYPGCENGSQAEKRKCLQENIASFIEKNFNKSIAEDLNLNGNHRITAIFKIDKEGIVSDIQAFASHTKLAQEAVRVLELVPKMKPAKQRGKKVITPYSIPIYFSVGTSTKNNPSLIRVKGRTTFERNFEEKLQTRDSVRVTKNSEATASQNSIIFSVNDVSKYAFSISQLGWVNCDRFVQAKKRFKYKVKIKDAQGANVKLVFKSLSSILPSKVTNNGYDFGLVPADEKVTLVAIKEVYGKYYLAIKDTETKPNSKLDLEFKAVTINELKEELIKLNNNF